ncbi:MAG TPA: gamma-butyrobetaine hydroxylase-like domain-containing protein [Gammaproteobacteria bacterium]|jgi:DUF971 family protein
MTGPSSPPPPTELKLKAGRRELEISFPDGITASLSAEYLRVHSPSAEVTLHGIGEGVLVVGKENVAIARIEPVGRYAVRLIFDDGHDTGLYTWAVLHDLCVNRERKWRRYRERVAAAAPKHAGSVGNDS